MQPYLTWVDFVLLPIYLAAIYFFADQYRNRHYPPGHPWRVHFMRGLFFKIGGAIFIVLLYVYYYGFGDTLTFYRESTFKTEAFWDSPWKWLNLVLEIPDRFDPDYYKYTSKMRMYQYGGNSMPVSISSVLSLVSFNSLLIISVWYAVISFTGIWALLRIFTKRYPTLISPLSICILYIPSVVMWGSPIYKDTIVLFSMCWLIYFAFKLTKVFRWKYLILISINAIIIFNTKMYLIIALTPALLFWILKEYSSKITSVAARKLLQFGLPFVMLIGIGFLASKFEDLLGGYSLDNVLATSEALREDILRDSMSSDGSGYSLGEIDSGPLGLLLAFPKAVNVTLFRPYLWESRKLIMLLSAIESTTFLLIFLYVIRKVGIGSIVKRIKESADVQFCLVFVLVFAFAVGISTYNFGTLSRYKIPCLPFFGIFLTLLYYGNKPDNDGHRFV